MVDRNDRLSRHLNRLNGLVLVVVVMGAACGGGDSGVADSPAHALAADAARAPGPARAHEQATLARGAQLNRDSLAAAEQQAQAAEQALPAGADPAAALNQLAPGATAPRSAYTSGQVAAKAAAVRIPAYRFYNGSTGAHFYTTSAAERDLVQATLSPPFAFEGSAFSVASDFSPGLSPVHRFFNTHSGVHFYTISEAERANVAAHLPHFSYEGVAYHASQVAGQGLVPLYRFYVPSRGFHFYTASASERDSIIANLGATYSYEGVGYHVLASDWRAEKLPHTGMTDSQCYRAGTDALVNCEPTPTEWFMGNGAIHLNSQQDGHRRAINTISYSAVVNPAGGNFPLTGCVRDNVTGLIWEGKEASGVRAGHFTYTNLGNGLAGDLSKYVQDVNALAPCGLSDWRVPTLQELHSLINFDLVLDLVDGYRALDTGLFPNLGASTGDRRYWSSTVRADTPERAMVVRFSNGRISDEGLSELDHVRLVSGARAPASRFAVGSVSDGSDAGSNVVNDALTGLQWRRCEEGQRWNGSSCEGAHLLLTHEQALAHARSRTGWRLPNARELATLMDVSRISRPFIHPLFPLQTGVSDLTLGGFWTSTPRKSGPDSVVAVRFFFADAVHEPRVSAMRLRLVRVP